MKKLYKNLTNLFLVVTLLVSKFSMAEVQINTKPPSSRTSLNIKSKTYGIYPVTYIIDTKTGKTVSDISVGNINVTKKIRNKSPYKVVVKSGAVKSNGLIVKRSSIYKRAHTKFKLATITNDKVTLKTVSLTQDQKNTALALIKLFFGEEFANIISNALVSTTSTSAVGASGSTGTTGRTGSVGTTGTTGTVETTGSVGNTGTVGTGGNSGSTGYTASTSSNTTNLTILSGSCREPGPESCSAAHYWYHDQACKSRCCYGECFGGCLGKDGVTCHQSGGYNFVSCGDGTNCAARNPSASCTSDAPYLFDAADKVLFDGNGRPVNACCPGNVKTNAGRCKPAGCSSIASNSNDPNSPADCNSESGFQANYGKPNGVTPATIDDLPPTNKNVSCTTNMVPQIGPDGYKNGNCCGLPGYMKDSHPTRAGGCNTFVDQYCCSGRATAECHLMKDGVCNGGYDCVCE